MIAAKKGNAPNIKSVTAAEVDVNERIKVKFAIPRLIPPIIPGRPILL